MQNAEFRPRIICGISDAEKTCCSVTKVVVCYLLNKRVVTFTIVSHCQQTAKHSAPVIPQSIPNANLTLTTLDTPDVFYP